MKFNNKEIKGVEILNLDAQGYGPGGAWSRAEWRRICRENCFNSRSEFNEWCQTIAVSNFPSLEQVDFSVLLIFLDDTNLQITHKGHPCEVDLMGHTFYEEILLEGTTFSPVNFQFSLFTAGLSLCDFSNNNVLNISNCEFWHEVIFENFNCASIFGANTIFKRNLTFINAYASNLNLQRSFFEEGIQLNKSSINIIDLTKSSLNEEITLINCEISILNCEFSKLNDGLLLAGEKRSIRGSSFRSTIFGGTLSFNGLVCDEDINFDGASFLANVDFSRAVFNGRSNFRNVKFGGNASFENAIFQNVGHFEGARFYSTYPSFRGCKIDQTRLEFSEEESFPHHDCSEDAIKNISFLKRLSDEHGQLDQALDFNALELRAKCKREWRILNSDKYWLNISNLPVWRAFVFSGLLFNGKFWFCVFTYLYEKLSDYGRSFTRPLFYLLGLLAVSYLFGIISAFENSPALYNHSRQQIFSELGRVYYFRKQENLISISGYRAAMEYSLYRSSNFLDFTDNDKDTASINMRLFSSEIEPIWARLFGFFKGITTTVLLFLTALGLRNRYRVS